MGLPLARFPIASTSDADEAEAVLSNELAELHFAKVHDHSAFGLQMNGVHLGQTLISYTSFETDTVVDAGRIDDMIMLIVGGAGPPVIPYVDGEPVVCDDYGAILSPSRRTVIQRSPGGGTFVIKAGFDAIERRFHEVMDRRPGKPIVFNHIVDLKNGAGAQWRRILDFLVGDVHGGDTLLENPLLRVNFDDMLLNALLGLPSNYHDELMAGPRLSAAPWLVRRAEEFLEANATEPITISDVVAECGCSRSSLFNAFRRYRAYTPRQFLAESRLKSARTALQSPAPGDTVTSIAHALGFLHRGRFAEAYRRRFGERPSETLRRAAPTNGA